MTELAQEARELIRTAFQALSRAPGHPEFEAAQLHLARAFRTLERAATEAPPEPGHPLDRLAGLFDRRPVED